MYEYRCENCTCYCTCNYCASLIAVAVMMVVVTMTAVCYNNRALNDYRTLNDNWSFNDYRSVMMVMMSWHGTNCNNRSVMMMVVAVVMNFNAMMITVVMMLC